MQYIKDNQIVTANVGQVVLGNRRIFNPTAEILIEAGFVLYTPPEPEPMPEPEPPPKQYSQLKIIRALGDEWQIYRKMLEDAGVLDQFFAADYLQEDDPVFAEFISNVPDELKTRLAECEV